MRDQEIIGLWEAYQQVHAQPQEELEVVDEAMSSYDRNRKRAAQRAADRNAARRRGQTGNVPGVGYVSPRQEGTTWTDESGQQRHHTGARMPKKEDQKESVDLFDYLLEYLVAEGYADTNKAALAIMANMSEEWKQSIVEQEGFRSDGRYQLPDGRHMGPIPGAIRALFTGNLPKSRTYVPPSTQTPTNRPPSIPASRGDDGQLTDFGKGGGKEKMKRTGMTVGQVERLGRRNMGDYSN